MKKILFFSAAAALMLASCANEETVQAPKGNAIDFGNAFVNNSTKAEDLTTTGIKNFDVYGYMQSMNGVVFNGEEVSKTGDNWTYSPTQYWTPEKAYWFAAIAPSKAATFTAPTGELPTGAAGTITFENTKGDTDLCSGYLNYTAKATGNDVQKFTFGHLLSRVKFTFNNKMANANAKLVISNVKITATNTAGTYNCVTSVWTANAATNDVDFVISNNEVAQNGFNATEPMYLIPGANSVQYNVEFSVVRYQGTELLDETPLNHKVVISGVQLELGKSYNFTADITDENVDPDNKPEPIVFGVETVAGWGPDVENNLTL